MRRREPSSFRDRAGYVFWEEGRPFRYVAEANRRNWEALRKSGLFEDLWNDGLLIPHKEVAFQPDEHPGAIALLAPEPIPFISYPYEWSFSQLKDAALTTLSIQRRCLARGLTLRDASAFNVQFRNRRPVFIDTLSFGIYEEGRPWAGYRQFCRHFLAPLALMAKVHPEMGRLLRPQLDGFPLDMASKCLPFRTKFDAGLAIHLHLHAKAERRSEGAESGNGSARVSKTGLLGLIDSLERTVKGLEWQPHGTVWADYYADTNYSDAAMQSKRAIVGEWIDRYLTPGAAVWDLGANTGEFSAIAAQKAGCVIAFDVDAGAVEKHYRSDSPPNVLPLIQDLTNPSPGLGWDHRERASLASRASGELVMALALVHHLAIGNNVPLTQVAEFLARLAPKLIIEFVPKEDSQVQRLLRSREDIFDDYTVEGFEVAFGEVYGTLEKRVVSDSKRTVYLFDRKEAR